MKLVLEHKDQHHPMLKPFVLREDEEPGGSRRMQTQLEMISHKIEVKFLCSLKLLTQTV